MVGAIFSVLAAACAFAISYGQYQNQFMDTRKPVYLAIQTAVVTFVFFMVATSALPWIFRMATR